jgi:ribosome maturation factor RimP
VGRDVNVRLRGRGRRRATIVRVVAGDDAVILRLAGVEGEEVTVPLSEARDARLAVDWE